MKLVPIILGIILLAGSCADIDDQQPGQGKKIEIGYNRTIETVMILRSISDTDYFLSRVPENSTARPMLYEARKYFKDYKNHPAAIETERLFYDIQDIGGVLLQGVLYAEELPNYNVIYEPELEYWKNNKAILADYMRMLADFYKVADVATFLAEHKAFYDGAVAEASQYVNDSVTAVMENYFGKKNRGYKMYLLPMNPYGWGFSATTNGINGANQYIIISPVKDIDWDGNLNHLEEYGFGGAKAKEHYRELVVHELVHPFITNTIEQGLYKQQIAQYDTLYTPLLDSLMQEQGYSGWWSFVNEHLVRLAHIRVAELMDHEEADALRKTDVGEYKFVLIPEWEELMKQYEQSRDKYPSIDNYLPVMIDHFKDIDTAKLNSLLRG